MTWWGTLLEGGDNNESATAADERWWSVMKQVMSDDDVEEGEGQGRTNGIFIPTDGELRAICSFSHLSQNTFRKEKPIWCLQYIFN